MTSALPDAMTISLEQLERDLLQLPREVRAHLADLLAESVEKEVAALWSEEVQRRHEAFLRGEMETIPAEEVMAELRAKLLK